MNVKQHLLTGNELNAKNIYALLELATTLKANKVLHSNLLKNKHVALIFDKPSLRTRFSFTVAIDQLGGKVIESFIQTRKTEAPKDFIRVIQGYCDAVVIRTHSDHALTEMKTYATIPIVNSLTEHFHPCQTLADLLTLKETFKKLKGLKVAFTGDGNNVLHSLLIMATKLGITVHYACPQGHGPQSHVLELLKNNRTAHLAKAFNDPKQAVVGCHALYTDVWTSMGFDQKDESVFKGYQVNKALMNKAHKDAVLMHCMPMIRGKEISHDLPDQPYSVIFKQSENRLYAQKALLISLFDQGALL